MTKTPTDPDGKPGLRIETAASYLARDMIATHLKQFKLALLTDRAAATKTVAAYTDGLAGAMAFAVAGGFVSRDEIPSHPS